MNTLLKCEIIKKFGTQSDFAAAIGLQESYVSNVIRNRRGLSDKKARQWAELLEWPGDYRKLFKGSLEGS